MVLGSDNEEASEAASEHASDTCSTKAASVQLIITRSVSKAGFICTVCTRVQICTPGVFSAM